MAATDIRDIIALRFRPHLPGELDDDLDLGPQGFGLDSIALTELLVLCEERFGVVFPSTLFDGGPLTIRRLAAHALAGAAGADS